MIDQIWSAVVSRVSRFILWSVFAVTLILLVLGGLFSLDVWRQDTLHHAIWWVRAIDGAKTVGLALAALFIALQPFAALRARTKIRSWRTDRRSGSAD